MDRISPSSIQVAVNRPATIDLVWNSLPLTERNINCFLKGNNENSCGEAGEKKIQDMISVRVSKPVGYKSLRINESIKYKDSNKTKIHDQEKNTVREDPTCCECGMYLSSKVIVLLDCGHIICLECAGEMVASASPVESRGENIFRCPYVNGDTTGKCRFECYAKDIDLNNETKNVSIEFYSNHSVKNIYELERNIQCKIYINDELADELMTLEEAVQKHDDSYERPRCWFL